MMHALEVIFILLTSIAGSLANDGSYTSYGQLPPHLRKVENPVDYASSRQGGDGWDSQRQQNEAAVGNDRPAVSSGLTSSVPNYETTSEPSPPIASSPQPTPSQLNHASTPAETPFSSASIIVKQEHFYRYWGVDNFYETWDPASKNVMPPKWSPPSSQFQGQQQYPQSASKGQNFYQQQSQQCQTPRQHEPQVGQQQGQSMRNMQSATDVKQEYDKTTTPSLVHGSAEEEQFFHMTSTAAEATAVAQIRANINCMNPHYTDPWLWNASNLDLLRFVRARKCDTNSAWNMLMDHVTWRNSPEGVNSLNPNDDLLFSNCYLNNEIYWSGFALDGTPVITVRAVMHRTKTDRSFFTRYIVWLIEQGRRNYGVGRLRQVYVIVDRTTPSYGVGPDSSSSLAANLQLIRSLLQTLQSNYPEILKSAYIAPVNTIFNAMFKTAAMLVDEHSRSKVKLINEGDRFWFQSTFPHDILSWELLHS